MNKVRYQTRFVKQGTRCKPGTIYIRYDWKEYTKWRQYYVDQRTRARLDPHLTLNQRKEILEACDSFEWRPDRNRLIKEPIDDYRADDPLHRRTQAAHKTEG